jgi:branched-chain amino acid transport system substrate-binding protein
MVTSGWSRSKTALGRRLLALVCGGAVIAAACGGGGDQSDAPAPTTAASSAPTTVAEGAGDETPGGDSTPSDTPDANEQETPTSTEVAVPESGADRFTPVVSALPAPIGEPFGLGLVNTEGVPGLDFPEIRTDVEAVVEYLNSHGGIGGRPIELKTCVAAGSPESSQACAQELVGRGVELVMLGFDLFAHYPTYAAEGVPVMGILPILPPDYTADALFVTGGNLTVTAAMVAVVVEHFAASKVAIVSADSVGSNSTEASLITALDAAGVEHVSVKGAENETDAGYQGLMRQADRQGADLLISLYGGDGCVGTMRGRAGLGITTPVLSTTACAEARVIDEVGDDALGWTFAGVGEAETTANDRLLAEILAPSRGVSAEEVDTTALGLGLLGVIGVMSLAKFGHDLVDSGATATGAALFDYIATTKGDEFWPSGPAMDCGASQAYPSICSFDLPVAQYSSGGILTAIPELDSVSALEYLP